MIFSHLYSPPQSPIISKRLFAFVVIENIAERSSESNFTSNALELSSICSEIPSLAPIITPATAGLSKMNL